jgi:cellulose synthase/poly-beta-1,6-N-acetylglucosamine synthase-like glycosyltransferase
MIVLSTEKSQTSPTQPRNTGSMLTLRLAGPLEAVLAPTDHELTVIIPAYNEQSRLPRSLATLAEYLDASKIDYRVLVADDGSSRQSACLMAAKAAPCEPRCWRRPAKSSRSPTPTCPMN